MIFSSDALITRSKEPVETTVGTETVLMSLASGECYGLGDTGSAVWQKLAEPIRVADLVAALRSAYDAPEGVLEADLDELLTTLVQRKLIVVS